MIPRSRRDKLNVNLTSPDATIFFRYQNSTASSVQLCCVCSQDLCTGVHERDKYRVFARDLSSSYVNNLLAASSCTLTVVALHFVLGREAFDHWTLMRCVQGTIAGVVTVSAAANDYSPQIAIALGCLGGVLFYLVSTWIFRSALEDYCNVVGAHLVCAILGSILAPFCIMRTDENTVTILLTFSWQLICLAALLALVGAAMLLIFGILECCGILRNKAECLNHARANAAVDKGPSRRFLRRLFSLDSGCFYLQPGSTSNTGHHSIDSRFWKYQEEVDKLEEGRSTAVDKPNVKAEDNVTKIQVPGQ